MKCLIIILLTITLFSKAFPQTDNEIKNEISLIKNELNRIDSELKNEKRLFNSNNQEITLLKTEISKLGIKIDSLEIIIKEQYLESKGLISKVDFKVDNSINKTTDDLTNISNDINQKTIYWVIIITIIVIVLILIFVFLRKRISKNKSDIFENIKQTTNKLHQDQLRLDENVIKLLDTQLKIMQEEQKETHTKSGDIDHSLALKVADEIVRIQKNLNNMEPETKGLKQLSASVERIQDNFKANGYEMVDMLNKTYDQGMKVSPTFRPDTNLKQGEQIITRIIKPQVNFKGEMIQAAQVEVSVGE